MATPPENPGMPPCCWELYLKVHERIKKRCAHDDPAIEAYCKHLKTHDKTHVGNGRYQGAFAFTLTASPADNYTQADFVKAAQKICKQKSQPFVKWAWYLEYKGCDADGLPKHPHIHGMYETKDGKKLEDKHFRRAWPHWMEKDPKTKKVIILGDGFRGGYHRPVKDAESYSDYISKDCGIHEHHVDADTLPHQYPPDNI